MKIFIGYDGNRQVFQQYKEGEKIMSLEEAISSKNQYIHKMLKASNDYDHYLQNERHDNTMRPCRGF